MVIAGVEMAVADCEMAVADCEMAIADYECRIKKPCTKSARIRPHCYRDCTRPCKGLLSAPEIHMALLYFLLLYFTTYQ